MLSGISLLIVIFLAIAFIIISSSVFKLHPFLALFSATVLTGLIVGVPLPKILESLNQGFGNLMGNIGLVVVIGTLIGLILERSGAAYTIANFIIGLLGNKKPALAMAIIGAIVGIPVFSDSGFIILSGLTKPIAQKTGKSRTAIALALGGGIFSTHTLVPPTPGPIAAAGNVGLAEHLGLVILMGLLVAIPATLVIYFYASFIGKYIVIEENTNIQQNEEPLQRPWVIASFLPIIIPVLLISAASFINFFQVDEQSKAIIKFLGSPLTALSIGFIFSVFLIKKWDGEFLNDFMNKGIAQAGVILIITAAGGAFGTLLKATPIAQSVSDWVSSSQSNGIWFLPVAFLIAALMKTAQGSTTASLVISSSILAPLLPSVGFNEPLELVILVMALGGGAMTFSHANDSYFWVIAQFSGLTVKDAYRGWSVMTFLQGITTFITAIILYILLI